MSITISTRVAAAHELAYKSLSETEKAAMREFFKKVEDNYELLSEEERLKILNQIPNAPKSFYKLKCYFDFYITAHKDE